MNFLNNSPNKYSNDSTFNNELKEIKSELNRYIEIIFSGLSEDFYKKINPQVHININDDLVSSPEESSVDSSIELEFRTVNFKGKVSILSAIQDGFQEYNNQKDFIQELFQILLNRFQAYLEYKLERRDRYSIFYMFPSEYSAREAIRHLLIHQMFNADKIFLLIHQMFNADKISQYCDPFEICSRVSTLLSEGEACAGKILFLKSNLVENNHNFIRLKRDIAMVPEEIRKIRKILGTTEEKYYLVADGYKIYGLLSKDGVEGMGNDIYYVEFKRQFYWQLGKISGDDFTALIDIKYSDIKFPKKRINEQELGGKIEDIFKKECDVSKLTKIIEKMIDQKHGTMLVILDKESSQSESERLNTQNFAIEPIELDPDSCLDLTNIDGSILLDSFGKCYGLGVILDGEASEKCDISRGARYNSAIRYSEKMKMKKILIVVISEDGMIDIFPRN
jgi:DNA integrity scanning protein DisA with diadenylate cyclase activity